MTANSRKIASSKKCPRIREKTNDVLNWLALYIVLMNPRTTYFRAKQSS
jgi:hypothetical protein